MAGQDEGFHIFAMGISPTGTVVARLDFELTNCDLVVQYFTHYATGTSSGEC